MIKFIDMKPYLCNHYNIKDEDFVSFYKQEYKSLCPGQQVTPIPLPFFHLDREPYYHLKWRPAAPHLATHAHSPSAKFLRDHVAYAYFDEELWNLLQDKAVRAELTEALIDHFINPD